MDYVVSSVITELPTKTEWRAIYSDNGFKAKLAYKNALWVHMRTRLSESQNWKCCWCGCKTTDERGHPHSNTVEHVIPRSEGGSDEWENLAMACQDCNHRRGTHSVEAFMSGEYNRDALNKRERQRAKRERRYMKRAEQFTQNGWIGEDGKRFSFSEWLDSLRGISDNIRNQLIQLYGV